MSARTMFRQHRRAANILQRLPRRMVSSSPAAASNPFVLKSKYADFDKAQANRAAFDRTVPVVITQSPNPSWKYGQGTDSVATINPSSERQPRKREHNHVEIDPYDSSRSMLQNYQLLISGIPRPISFISTVSSNGCKNLSPFSYFQVVDHDPPIFVVGFSARASRLKDTRRNLVETRECVINIVSEHMAEAVNATSLDLPYETSEWALSGLQPAPSSTVKPERVREAVFSIEGRLLEMKELDYGGRHAKEGKASGALAIIEGTRFWVRSDAVDETQSEISLNKLRPLVQLGGISYGRVRETFEVPRPRLEDELVKEEKGLKAFFDGGDKSSNKYLLKD